jgi:hypothetical protein
MRGKRRIQESVTVNIHVQPIRFEGTQVMAQPRHFERRPNPELSGGGIHLSQLLGFGRSIERL